MSLECCCGVKRRNLAGTQEAERPWVRAGHHSLSAARLLMVGELGQIGTYFFFVGEISSWGPKKGTSFEQGRKSFAFGNSGGGTWLEKVGAQGSIKSWEDPS